MSSSDEMEFAGDDIGPMLMILRSRHSTSLWTTRGCSSLWGRSRASDFQPQPGQPQQAEISFRLFEFPYHLSLAEFGSVLGLYTEEETHMPIYMTAIHTADDAVFSAWWLRIGDETFVRAARPAGMEAFHPVRLDRRTVHYMRIVQRFPRLGL
ncbi:hypothetical protein E3N88_08345 [Mikania micrantha]|uniref:Uncharacterized protein n=1 Tax=Mikania micrantha TaxID=192012 RepID=A0A5N6PFX8_9ASTR|nr:hypothetical protein E3N88_08345 [Mikania micrantha]